MPDEAPATKRADNDSIPDPAPPSKRVRLDNVSIIASPKSPHNTSKADSIIGNQAQSPEMGAEDRGSNATKKDKSMSGSRGAYVKTPKGKGKDRNAGRRSRRGTRNDEAQAGEGDVSGEGFGGQPKAPRLPKRQCALLIGFCGSGYSGMQIQPTARTIENALFDAMVKVGAVSQDNADDPVKVNIGRAARTDAGVHAAGNVVSMKMITSIPGVPDIVVRINEELPPEIRLWGYVRVQNSFNARLLCDSRKYTYFFPTYLLLPPKPGSNLERTLQRHAASLSPVPQEGEPRDSTHSFWTDIGGATHEEELLRKRAWRVGPDQIARLRATAQKYEGTHNFHNFTVGRDFGDRSNQRYMKKIEIADPQVYGETEWISVLFHGQSFMLHQRKMMSGLVLSCRTDTPDHVIDELYGPRVVLIPKMPSLGLLLEQPIFGSYNSRVAAINEKFEPSNPEYRPPIDFEIHQDAMVQFRQKYIYDNMREVEDRTGLFDAWIKTVDSYAGNDLLYLNPRGTIPAAAVIKKNDWRENPFKEKRRFDATSFSPGDDATTRSQEDSDEEDAPLDRGKLADTEG